MLFSSLVTQLRLSLAIAICALLIANGSVATAQVDKSARRLAPGILKVVSPQIEIRDTYSVQMPLPGRKTAKHTFKEHPEADSLHEKTQRIVFYRDVYQYEFAFLPLRQMLVDIPYPDKKMRQKNVLYMVFRVRNLGKNVSYIRAREQQFNHELHKLELDKKDIKAEAMQGRFIPTFTLEGLVQDLETGDYRRVEYSEQILPTAVKDIQNYEDPNRELLSTVDFMRSQLAVEDAETGEGTWGVATWTDVNPKIDYASVFVKGITNAYRIDRKGEAEPTFRHKTLQINFWRPGDEIDDHEDRIRYGVPLVENTKRQIEICKRYQLPGPEFEIYEQDKATNLIRLVATSDANVDMKKLESPYVSELNDGKLPASIQQSMADRGFLVPATTAVNREVTGEKWTMSANVDGKDLSFQIRYVPQFWEKDGEGIRFIKSLDHFWIYR